MLHVLGARHVLQVGDLVISSDAIDVVYFLALRTRTNKRSRYKAMDRTRMANVVLVK